MEGPTPVSALIHAATLVTAGLFLIIRCSILFESCPAILSFVTIIGSLTAFFAASIGLVQNDLKKGSFAKLKGKVPFSKFDKNQNHNSPLLTPL